MGTEKNCRKRAMFFRRLAALDQAKGSAARRRLIGWHLSLRCFGAACHTSERNLFLAVGDFDCPNAHELFT
jgi:hypothetical protein